MSTQTPWGTSVKQKTLANGITYFSTSRHGGYLASPDRVAQMPPALRHRAACLNLIEPNGSAWFEEHNDWSLLALSYPEAFKAQDLDMANATMKHHYPDTWEAFTGKVIAPGESKLRDQERLKECHNEVRSYLPLYEHVPDGMMGVVTTVGGLRTEDAVESCWLVPKAEFDKSLSWFVINPDVHQRLAANIKFGAYKQQHRHLEAA